MGFFFLLYYFQFNESSLWVAAIAVSVWVDLSVLISFLCKSKLSLLGFSSAKKFPLWFSSSAALTETTVTAWAKQELIVCSSGWDGCPVCLFFCGMTGWLHFLSFGCLSRDQEGCQSQRKLSREWIKPHQRRAFCTSWAALINTSAEENPNWLKVNYMFVFTVISGWYFQLFSAWAKNVCSSDTCCILSVITRYIKEIHYLDWYFFYGFTFVKMGWTFYYIFIYRFLA